MTRSGWSCRAFLMVLAATSRPGVARAEPKVFLEIKGSTDHVRVLQRGPSGRDQTVCTGPCERSLDQDAEYVLETGLALMPTTAHFTKSQLFTLPPDRPRVLLDVTPVSKLRPVAGWTLFAAGIAAVLASTGALLGDNPGGPGASRDTPSRYWLAAYPLGLATAGFGAYLLGTSGPRVTSDTGAVLQR